MPPNNKRPRPEPRVPVATYRLQFNRDFTFAQAEEAAEYLHALGISDLYASPLFQAGPESTHGYDICSFQQFNPALGTEADFDQLSGRLRELGLGLILDMVPNHMGNDLSNAWWLDVLKFGRHSPFASYFDIDWSPPNPALRDKVLLPTLEDHYARVLESGKLQLVQENGDLVLAYHDRRFPIDPSSIGLPADGSLEHFNGQPGLPRSFDRLHALLDAQHYRLAYWRLGPEEINYRRFFDVTQLVGIRMELPEVFAACHRLVFDLLREGQLTGLRIDHPDGLWDPREYFRKLQEGFAAVAPPETPGTAPGLYVVAEKILSGDEELPSDWLVAGTTGYDFLNQVNGLFVNPAHRDAFDRLSWEFTGHTQPFRDLAYDSKRRILEGSLASERRALTYRFRDLAARSRSGQDFSFSQIQRVLTEVIAAFPVYRTYVTETSRELPPAEQSYIRQAISEVKRRNPDLEAILCDFLQDVLLLRSSPDFDESTRKLERQFVLRFQQLTGPATAKGLEDTAFYNDNRLVSLNEVGGEPGRFGVLPEAFHKYNSRMAAQWPHSLLATATHDTKRGEDVRARINVLSEMPADWETSVRRWSQLNADKKSTVGGRPAPHPNDEYLLYQTLLGAWPTSEAELPRYPERLKEFMTKALREGKARTNWIDPNTAYEDATRQFIEQIFNPAISAEFLADFQPFQRRVAFFGQFNSLSQVLLKMTSPGVPDFYQGTELWDLSLVDPDNRRPVDYLLRRRLLKELDQAADAGDPLDLLDRLLQDSSTGVIKLFTVSRALRFRQSRQELFTQGEYVPLQASGVGADNIVAFARVAGSQTALTIVPRLLLGLGAGKESPPLGPFIWRDTMLALPGSWPGTYRNQFTGELLTTTPAGKGQCLPLSEVLHRYPVALLEHLPGTEI